MAADTEDRLGRIEAKIDKLSEAMIDLARAEEKLINIEKSNQAMFERMNRFSQRMDEIEKTVQDNQNTVKIINKVFYVILAGIATMSINQIIG
jgi:hypothetical protein